MRWLGIPPWYLGNGKVRWADAKAQAHWSLLTNDHILRGLWQKHKSSKKKKTMTKNTNNAEMEFDLVQQNNVNNNNRKIASVRCRYVNERVIAIKFAKSVCYE